MTIGTLFKITAHKKLMIKISEKSHAMIHAHLTNESNKRNYPTDRLATFMIDGGDAHFMMISPDKYDRMNMRKFEVLLKKNVFIQYRLKPYDFIPDGQKDHIQGINLELITIRLVKPAAQYHAAERAESALSDNIARMIAARLNETQELNAEEQAIDEDVEKQVLENIAKMKPAGAAVADMITRISEEREEGISQATITAATKLIDTLPGQATRGLRMLMRQAEAAEHDAWVEKKVTDMMTRCRNDLAQYGKLSAETREAADLVMIHMPTEQHYRLNYFWANDDDLPLAPPVLTRQRRRVRPGFVSQALPEPELTGVLAEVKKIEDLIAANERAIGAGTDE